MVRSFLATRPLAATCIVILGTAACFDVPEPGNDEVGTESDTTTDTTDTTTDTTTTTTDTTDTTDMVEMLPPVIDVFTVAGSTTPDPVMLAGAVEIVVEASDPDGSIAEVQIFRDGQPFATIPGPGPYTAEFVVGGEDFDGSYEFTATAIDDDALEADSDPITLGVDVTSGVEIEVWTFDSGASDNAYRVEVDADGSNVIAGGTTYINNESRLRIDRHVGGGWVDKVDDTAYAASGLGLLPSGEAVVTTWTTDSSNQSQMFRYDPAGMQLSVEQGDWTSPGTPPGNFEAPVDMVVGPDGNYYAVGVFTKAGDNGPNSTYMFEFNPAGDLLWAYHSDVAMQPPYPIYGISIDIGPDYLIVGGQSREQVNMATDYRIWMGRWDLDGNFLDDVKIAGDGGYGWTVGAGANGESMLGGIRFLDNIDDEAWLGRFGANGQPLWTKQGMHTGVGMTIAADIDPWGDSVAVVLEDCAAGFLSYGNCDLFIRKYDEDGVLKWELAYDDDTFFNSPLVPLAGELEFDRFGYIYVAAPHFPTQNNGDWWVVKVHP